MTDAAPSLSTGRLCGLGLLAWLTMLGVDFFLHGGLLAGFYVEPGPFLLPPAEAFRLIPLGYLAFLLLAIMLLWLMVRLGVAGCRPGLMFGLQLGALVWGALVLGLASVTSAPWALLAGWFAGQSLEMGVAGAVMGSGLAGRRLGGLLWRVAVLVLVLLVLTVVLQSVGLAPALKVDAPQG